MTMRWFNVALFSGLAVWMGADGRWVAVGFAVMAAGQACIALFWSGHRRTWSLVEAFGLLTFFGIADIVASGVGKPTTARFWLVLAVSLVVLMPIALLARRLGRARARG